MITFNLELFHTSSKKRIVNINEFFVSLKSTFIILMLLSPLRAENIRSSIKHCKNILSYEGLAEPLQFTSNWRTRKVVTIGNVIKLFLLNLEPDLMQFEPCFLFSVSS